jgi:hypothetical protein
MHMKFRITDERIFDVLRRNQIDFWPELRANGVALSLRKGETMMMHDGSLLENDKGQLVLKKLGDTAFCKCEPRGFREGEACMKQREWDNLESCACPCHKAK